MIEDDHVWRSQLAQVGEEVSGGPLTAAISNEMVRLLATHFGRGPTRARSIYVDDVVICRLEEPFTVAEQTLIRAGRLDEVRMTRAIFNDELRPEFTGAIERLTGRPVTSFLSDVQVDPQMAVAVFILGPAPGQDGHVPLELQGR
jgi:uncharacterized protein YbcI